MADARIVPSKICTSSITWPRLAGAGLDGGEQQLALDRRRRVELGDLDDVDQLVELLDDLLERRRLDVDDDGDAAEALVVGGRDGQRVDVVAAPGEQARRRGPARRPCSRRAPTGCGGCACGSAIAQRLPSPWNGSATWISSLDCAGGDHREHLLRRVGAELDDDRSVVDLVGLVDGRLDLLGRLDPDADAAHRLGPLHVVGQVGRQVHLGVALVVEHLLPLAHHAEVGVVEDGDLDRDALGRRGDQLLRGHLEAAVAVDRPHHAVGPADLGADGGRHREAHGAEPAGVDPRVGVVELPVLAAPTSGAGRRPSTRMRVVGASSRGGARARTAA